MILEAQRALDANARLPSSIVYRKPMVAGPRCPASEAGISSFSPTLYFTPGPFSFAVGSYQLLVESMAEVARPRWVIFNCRGRQLQEHPVKPFLKRRARVGSEIKLLNCNLQHLISRNNNGNNQISTGILRENKTF